MELKSPNLDTPDPIENEEKSQIQEVEDRDNRYKKRRTRFRKRTPFKGRKN